MGISYYSCDESSTEDFGSKRVAINHKKLKMKRSTGKVLLTAFLDSEGMLLKEIVSKCVTVNKDTYFNTLMRL